MLSKKHDSYESIRDERRYGPYWYSALWRIIRPILIGLGTVLVVAGSPPRETAAVTLEERTEQVLRLVAQGIRLKDAAREVSAHTGLSKNELYAAALERS